MGWCRCVWITSLWKRDHLLWVDSLESFCVDLNLLWGLAIKELHSIVPFMNVVRILPKLHTIQQDRSDIDEVFKPCYPTEYRWKSMMRLPDQSIQFLDNATQLVCSNPLQEAPDIHHMGNLAADRSKSVSIHYLATKVNKKAFSRQFKSWFHNGHIGNQDMSMCLL